MDLRLNENKIRSVHYSSLSRFGNLTYLNLTKNDISYVEDGAFSAQFNLQVGKTMISIACGQTDNCTVLRGHATVQGRNWVPPSQTYIYTQEPRHTADCLNC